MPYLYRVTVAGGSWHVVARCRTHALRILDHYDSGIVYHDWETGRVYLDPRPLLIHKLHGNTRITQWADGDGPTDHDLVLRASEWVRRCVAVGEDCVSCPL